MATPTYNPAYKSKSDLVNAGYGGYSSWNDEASIMANYKETGGEGKYTGGANPSSADQLPGYLDNYQSNLFGNIAMPDLKIPTADELKKSLTPAIPAPTPINRSAMLEEKKTKLGVGDLETELNTLKNEERQIQAQLRETTGAEEGKTVALNVMSGRITEEQRQAQTKLDYLNVRKATLVDELNTKYNAINTFIQFAGLDYNDAVKAYEGEFDRNVKVQEMLSGYRKEAWTYTTDAIKLQEQIKQDAINNARANLTTVANAITNGNMNWDSISPDQKLQIQKLEIQSGLPVGIVQQMREKVDPKANIVFTTSNEGVTQIGFRNPDGTIRVESYGKSTSSQSTNALKLLDADIAKKLGVDALMKKYTAAGPNSLSPDQIIAEYNLKSPNGKAKESAEYLKRKYNVTTTTTSTKITAAEISKAKQIAMRNGLSDSDLKRIETDPDYALWLLANEE